MLLVQGQKCSLPSQYTVPGNQSQFRAPGLFIMRLFLTYVLLGIGGLSLVPVIRYLQFVTFRWVEWFLFYHYQTFSRYFLFLY